MPQLGDTKCLAIRIGHMNQASVQSAVRTGMNENRIEFETNKFY